MIVKKHNCPGNRGRLRVVMERRNISGGSRFEPIVGCIGRCGWGRRCLWRGRRRWGRMAGWWGRGSARADEAALAIIEGALAEAGASMADVVRTRMFVTDMGRWEEAGRARG